METFLIYIKKYGVNGVLAVGLFWMNERLTKVEDELYKCYDNSINHQYHQENIKAEQKFAILPKKEKYVSKKVESKNA